MPNTTINNAQSVIPSSASTRFVRTAEATNAQGFAQIMQAFAADSESLLTQESSTQAVRDEVGALGTSDDADARVNVTETNTDETDASSVDGPDEANGENKAQSDSQLGVQGDDASTNTQSIEQVENIDSGSTQAPVSEQETQADDAAFRLLENQSDQAKLSIKGLGHALSHAADIDLAAIATDVTLGRNTDGSVSTQPQQDIPQQQASNTRPESGNVLQREHVEIKPQQPTELVAQQTLPVESKIDQSTSDVQQVRSRRVDAAVVNTDTQASTAKNAQQVAGTSNAQSVGSSQESNPVLGMIRPTQANPTRVVTGIETGSIGSQSTDKQQGSLVEKMNQTELPSESRRASVMAQVQRGLASLLRSGKNEMTLKLTPGHLGDIKIRVKTDGKQLEVRFETTSDEATEHLNTSVKELTTSLRSKGLNLEQVHIEQVDTNPPNESTQGQVGDQAMQDRDEQQENHQRQKQSSQEDAQSTVHEDDEAQEPDSIWTQLGLDAIA